jgi:very-short-patch-repair endonuclease
LRDASTTRPAERREWADRRVAGVAAQRDGLITRTELAGIGLTRDAVAHRVARGRLRLVHPGVYAVGNAPLDATARLRAALLAAGDGATLSHHAAAAAHGLAPLPAGPVDVISRRRVRIAGVAAHRHALAPGERTTAGGLPATTVARTVLDLAAVVPPRALDRLIQEGHARRRVTRAQLERVLAAHPGARGTAALRDALAATGTRSELERAFLRLVRAAGLPVPETNVRLGGFEVDALWRAARVVVELDGFAAHASPWAHDRDRRKDSALRAIGHTMLRFSAGQVRRHPHVVVADVARALGSAANVAPSPPSAPQAPPLGGA